MCSRIWDNPAPKCWSSSMLPVAHQACTLATGALRSSCTIIVSPFGRIHFCAVLGGKLMAEEGSVGAALRLTMLNNKPAQRNFANGIQFICDWLGRVDSSDQGSGIGAYHLLSRRSGLPRRQMRRRFRSCRFFRGEGFHESLFEIINVFEIFD